MIPEVHDNEESKQRYMKSIIALCEAQIVWICNAKTDSNETVKNMIGIFKMPFQLFYLH